VPAGYAASDISVLCHTAEGDSLAGTAHGQARDPRSPVAGLGLPEVFNKLQDLRVEVRHRLSNRLAATVSYRYEAFDVYDFAFSEDVIDSIVQPSSLILRYLYRPYTAHSAVVGVLYSW
jgi:Putative outer membrane beta-barrel porin, MtrB/PioB